MRILWQAFDTTNYTGGPIINALRLLPELVRRGHQVLAVFEYFHEHPNVDRLRAMGVESVAFSPPEYAEDHVRLFLEQIVRFKPDVFVSNISPFAGLAGHWARKWGIPVIHTKRGDDPLNNGMAEFFFAGERRWRLSLLVSVNRFLFEETQALTSEAIPHRIIPSGVPLSRYKADQSAPNGFRVVYAGRITDKIKRVSEVVSAFIDLALKDEALSFSIIGSGDTGLEEKLRTTVNEYGLGSRIVFTGKLEGEIYKRKLAEHQVIVLLSESEGIPGSIMDGMSCGLIPVVYKTNGIDELVSHEVNGIIVNDRQGQFFDAILRLKEDGRLRQQLSKEAVETVAKRFSLPVILKAWEDLFYELCRSGYTKKSLPTKPPRKIKLFRQNPLLPGFKSKPDLKAKLIFKFKNLGKAVRNLQRRS